MVLFLKFLYSPLLAWVPFWFCGVVGCGGACVDFFLACDVGLWSSLSGNLGLALSLLVVDPLLVGFLCLSFLLTALVGVPADVFCVEVRFFRELEFFCQGFRGGLASRISRLRLPLNTPMAQWDFLSFG